MVTEVCRLLHRVNADKLPTHTDASPLGGDEPVQVAGKSAAEISSVGVAQASLILALGYAVIAAYNAPYPDESYKEGARQFPLLVPITPDNPASEKNRAAWKVLSQWNKPFLTAFSDQDPVTAGGDKVMQKLIPGTQGQAHTTIVGGGHFLQEDKGEALAEITVQFIADNPA